MWKGSISDSFINDLILKTDIVETIERFFPLKKTGKNFNAKCPFHTENSASFSVNREKQFYHCFGCGAGGNVINFMSDYNHFEFVESIEELASFINMPVVYEKGKNQSPQENLSDLYDLNKKASDFFVSSLNKKTKDYLYNRGISDETIKKFNIGYAPDGWSALKQQFNNKDLLRVGLLVDNEKNTYDRFRDRVIFPIIDRRHRVIGFGGRIFEDKGKHGKYLNSPDSPLFNKGNELYGMPQLLKEKGNPDFVLVTEGYMDVVSLDNQGFHFSVAALGTAFSENHIKSLFKITNVIIFCFDGDKAGRAAAWKALITSLPELKDGRKIKFMMLPDVHDPDSLISELKLEKFTNEVNQSTPLSAYFFDVLSKDLNLNHFEDKSTLAKEAFTLLNKLPNGDFKELMLVELKNKTNINKTIQPIQPKKGFMSGIKEIKIIELKRSPLKTAIQALLFFPVLYKEISSDLLSNSIENIDILKEIVLIIKNNPSTSGAAILSHFFEKPEEMELKKILSADFTFDKEQTFNELKGAINSLITLSKNIRLNELKEKSTSKEGLLIEEKNEFLTLLQA